MEVTTTDTQNDTIVVSVETFLELYYERPEESEGQLYFDGFAVRIVDVELGKYTYRQFMVMTSRKHTINKREPSSL